VIDRPAELATDRSTVDDAARHAVEALERAGIGCDAAVILYANVPVRPEGLIDDAVRLLLETGCDSVQSYCPVGKHHPWWTVRVESGNGTKRATVRPWEGDVLYHNTFRRQDLPPAYVPDGGVCAVTRRSLFRQIAGVPAGPHAFLGRDRRAVITGEGAVIDIDSPIDLLVANAILGGAAGAPPLVRTA
jgi:CMP-N-acetylneuraminic acid synthetase